MGQSPLPLPWMLAAHACVHTLPAGGHRWPLCNLLESVCVGICVGWPQVEGWPKDARRGCCCWLSASLSYSTCQQQLAFT